MKNGAFWVHYTPYSYFRTILYKIFSILRTGRIASFGLRTTMQNTAGITQGVLITMTITPNTSTRLAVLTLHRGIGLFLGPAQQCEILVLLLLFIIWSTLQKKQLLSVYYITAWEILNFSKKQDLIKNFAIIPIALCDY